MKHLLRILFMIILLVAIGWTSYYFIKKNNSNPVVYQTKSPVVTDIVNKTVATGSIIPRKEIEIKPHVSGIIDELYVEAGNEVKKGDLLAKIQVIPDMISLNNAESRVNQAKINYEDAKIVYNRNKKLFDKGVIAEAEYLQIKLSFNSAQEELDAAENHLQLIREGVSKKSGKTTNTLIRSTINGMVLDVPVEVGNSVIESNNFNDGTTIVSVANMNDMIFEGKIDETEVGKIKIGMPLILTIGALDDVTFNATLEYISPKGIEENGAIQFEIRAKVNLKSDYFIRAGYSATADIVLEKREKVLAIEESLLHFEKDSVYVEIEVDTQKFEKRFIETGLSDGINIEVKAGLKESDKLKLEM